MPGSGYETLTPISSGWAAFQQIARRENVLELFTHVTELDEESDANAHGLEPLACDADLATVVPLFMASNTRWLPLSAPIQASRHPASRALGHALAHQVRAGLDGERYVLAAGLQRGGELGDPVDSESRRCRPRTKYGRD